MEVKLRFVTRHILFNTMDATAPTPEKPLMRQDTSSTHYYVYNYINVIDMLNKSLETAMLTLAAGFADGQDRGHMQTYAIPFLRLILKLAR